MTKSELIETVAQKLGLTKMKAESIVNTVFDSMVASLERGEGIEIRGFGSFTVRHYKSYAGRNPRTGDKVEVPPKRLPFFKVGKELKALVDGQVPPIPSPDETSTLGSSMSSPSSPDSSFPGSSSSGSSF